MKNILKMGIISALIGLLSSCKEQVSPLSEDYYKKSGAIYLYRAETVLNEVRERWLSIWQVLL